MSKTKTRGKQYQGYEVGEKVYWNRRRTERGGKVASGTIQHFVRASFGGRPNEKSEIGAYIRVASRKYVAETGRRFAVVALRNIYKA
jgi:hypothetical protein